MTRVRLLLPFSFAAALIAASYATPAATLRIRLSRTNRDGGRGSFANTLARPPALASVRCADGGNWDAASPS